MKRVDEASRRRILQRAAAMGAVVLAAPWRAALASLSPTPAQTRGPFYPDPVPLETDGDLTMLKGAKSRAGGDIIHVSGRLLDRDGKPVPGATIEIWRPTRMAATRIRGTSTPRRSIRISRGMRASPPTQRDAGASRPSSPAPIR